MVTGASSGIGRAVALAFGREGVDVVVNDHTGHDAAADCVAEIEAIGRKACMISADVADGRAVAKLVQESKEEPGGIDIWANIAGANIFTGSAAALSDLDKLDKLINVDLRGTIQCCWAAAPMITQGGSIINLSWDLALRGMEGRNPEMIAAVKAGITGYTRSLARSLAPRIRVNEIAPGWIETSFAESKMDKNYRESIISSTPMRRFGQPEDVASAAVYLASDESSFVTGQTIAVNGGLSS